MERNWSVALRAQGEALSPRPAPKREDKSGRDHRPRIEPPVMQQRPQIQRFTRKSLATR